MFPTTLPTQTSDLTTATAETERGQRIRALLTELGEINHDRERAARFADCDAVRDWRRELDSATRTVWDHIHEAATGH